MGEPLPIQETQESVQKATYFEVPKITGKAANEKLVSDDTLVVRKSIESGKPTLALQEVGYCLKQLHFVYSFIISVQAHYYN